MVARLLGAIQLKLYAGFFMHFARIAVSKCLHHGNSGSNLKKHHAFTGTHKVLSTHQRGYSRIFQYISVVNDVFLNTTEWKYCLLHKLFYSVLIMLF